MEKDNVFLARRTSGGRLPSLCDIEGGAVFQDLGNTNFTFLNNLSSYDKAANTKIIIKALDRFGVKVITR